MKEQLFTTTQLSPGILQLTGPLGFCASLILGSRRALLFDTMSGIGDLKGFVSGLTSLPLTVVNSHGHFDHAGGNYQFDEVWLSPAEYANTLVLRDSDRRRQLIQEVEYSQNLHLPEELRAPLVSGTFDRYLFLSDGQIFDLGGRTAQVVPLPGHTPGSVGLLLPEDGILLSGDAMTPVMCLFFPESLPLSAYKETLLKAQKLPWSHFVTGHMTRLLPKSLLNDFLASVDAVSSLKGMRYQFNLLPKYGGWLYLYKTDGPREEETLGVILREPRPGDNPPVRKRKMP